MKHWIIQSGNYYYTWLGGYSFDINNAMYVKDDFKLVGNQQFVRIRTVNHIEILYYGK